MLRPHAQSDEPRRDAARIGKSRSRRSGSGNFSIAAPPSTVPMTRFWMRRCTNCVGAAIRRKNSTDMNEQRFIAEMAALGNIHTPRPVFMVAGDTHKQHPALHPDGPDPFVPFNKGVLHRWPFAKNAVAFPKMSRSIVTRANSARSRLISICSAVTWCLPEAPFNLPARCSLIQLPKVCSTTPKLRAAPAIVWPDSTSRTASCLNSSV